MFIDPNKFNKNIKWSATINFDKSNQRVFENYLYTVTTKEIAEFLNGIFLNSSHSKYLLKNDGE